MPTIAHIPIPANGTDATGVLGAIVVIIREVGP